MDELERLISRENLVLATVKQRLLAHFIDDLLISLVAVAMFWERIESAQDYYAIVDVMNGAVGVILFLRFIYQGFFIWNYGATLGKLMLKIRVVEVATVDKPSLLISLNRSLFRIISEFAFYLGFILAMFDPYRQALHDKTAKTLVIAS